MAATISKVKCKEYEAVELTFTALATSYKTVDFTGVDENTLFIVQNTASAEGTVTIKAGNGIGGVTDLEIKIPQQKTVAFTLNSQEFKSVTGADKGCVSVKGSATTLSLAVVEHL